MRSKARIGNHPIHPMLILVPAGAFIIALVCDVVYAFTGAEIWWEATLPILLIGVIGALLAAIPGVVDLVTVAPKQNATTIGIAHMVLNLIAVAVFAWTAWLRWGSAGPPPGGGAYAGLWMTLVGNMLIAVSGWLGGTMVYEHHVGVLEHPEAHDPDRRASIH